MPYNYEPVKNLLTEDEVREALYLDYDYTSPRLKQLSKQATQFLFQKTGHDWSSDIPVNETAKGAACDYIYLIWNGGDNHIQTRLDDAIETLSAMVDENGELYA